MKISQIKKIGWSECDELGGNKLFYGETINGEKFSKKPAGEFENNIAVTRYDKMVTGAECAERLSENGVIFKDVNGQLFLRQIFGGNDAHSHGYASTFFDPGTDIKFWH